MGDRKVFYIRHNFDIKKNPEWQEVIETLYVNKQIGIHFADYGFDEKKYVNIKSAPTAIRYLIECSDADEEILVVASYKGKDEIIIGTPKKKSKDNPKIAGLEIKYVQLENEVKISLSKFPMPFLAAPPFCTICDWDIGKIAINKFYNAGIKKEGPPDITPGLYSPGQLEVLCEEWLKEEKQGKLVRKLFKTGGGMKDYDIVGIDKQGQYIGAQVKYACGDNEIKKFLSSNDDFIDNPKNKYFFTSCMDSNGNPKNGKYFKDSISMNPDQVFSLESVVEYFKLKDSNYLHMLAFGNNLEQFVNQSHDTLKFPLNS